MTDHRRAVRVAVIGLAAHLVLAGYFLARHDGNPEWFMHFGDESASLPLARRILGSDLLVPHDDGHDGAYFWVHARDPLLLDEETVKSGLDRPAYRSQRLAYPALAAPWRVAGERGLVWGLLATNLVVVGVGGYAAGRLARRLGAPERAGFAFAASPAVLIAVLMDVGDGLAIAAVVAAVLALAWGRTGWAVAAGTAAVLAKEPMLLVLGGVALFGPGLGRRTRLALVAVSAGAAGLWALYARSRLGWPPAQIQEFAPPFWGYIDAWRRGWHPVGNYEDLVVALAVLAGAIVVVLRWWSRRTLLLGAALPTALMVPFLSAQVLDLSLNSLRAFSPALLFLWMDAYVRAPGSTTTPGPPRPAARRSTPSC